MLHDGRVFVDRRPHNKGSLNHPMKDREIKKKFIGNALLRIKQPQINDIYDCIMTLEDLKDITVLSSHLNHDLKKCL